MLKFLPLLPSSLLSLLWGGCLLLAAQTPLSAQPFRFGTPASQSDQATSSRYPQYLVYVQGDSELLLEQVRQIQPGAFITQYGGRNAIQVGLFNDELSAMRQVEVVEAQYIDAEIARIEPTRTLPAIETAAAAPPPPPDNYYLSEPCSEYSKGKSYFVVIPAPPKDLYDIEQQVIRLGAPTDGTCDREKPRGYHVTVGPFADRATAERWNRYLFDFGLRNARVYYGR